VAKVVTSNPDRTISLKRLQCVVENNNNNNNGGEVLQLHLLLFSVLDRDEW